MKPSDTLRIVNRKLDKAIRKAIDREALLKAGDLIIKIIKMRTLAGKGVQDRGGAITKLKPLSESYILARKGKIRFATINGKAVVVASSVSVKEAKSLRASKGALKGLAKQRKFLRLNKPKLSKQTSPSKSNVTQTGQVINAMRRTASVGLNKVITIFLSDTRGPDMYGNKSGKTNTEVARLLHKQGRGFFTIAKTEEKRVMRFLKKLISDKIRRAL